MQTLGSATVQGVSLEHVNLLRLDLTGGAAPGNKSFKLQEYLAQAQRLGVRRLVSFGGAWSNHLHALAAIGLEAGLETVGIVRGDAPKNPSAMLIDVQRAGMEICYVSREEYRKRNEQAYQHQLKQRFAPCLLIPEGGSSLQGARGCAAIAQLIREHPHEAKRIVLPVGTGTTLAGIAAALDDSYEIVGISALKGATDLEDRVDNLLAGLGSDTTARWRILHQYHCGGFARASMPLREFMLEFEAVHGIPLDPVYTGKMLYAIHQLRRGGEWEASERLLAIHTGGLQGRRGYSWLDNAE